jgi:opacity protein-like surface antigen
MSKRILAALLAATCIGTSALAAADMRVPVRAPAVIVADDWSGFYVGAEAGYGWGRQRFEGSLVGGAIDPFEVVTASFPEVSPGFRQDNVSQVLQPNLGAPLSTLNQRGWLAGAFFGAQKQWGSLVLGIDVDIDAVSVKGRVDAIAVHTSSLDVILVERQILTGPQGFQVGGASFPQIREFVSSRVVGGAPNATVTQTSTITSKLDQLGTPTRQDRLRIVARMDDLRNRRASLGTYRDHAHSHADRHRHRCRSGSNGKQCILPV